MFADPGASALDIVAFIGQNLADGVGCVFLGVNSSKGDMCEGAWKVYAGALIFGPPRPPQPRRRRRDWKDQLLDLLEGGASAMATPQRYALIMGPRAPACTNAMPTLCANSALVRLQAARLT